jgi:hypothetical protein
MARIDWQPVVNRAAEIVLSYDIPVTLRQLFYRLVMEELIPNTRIAYQTLSARTAAPRRAGTFPPLFDRTRSILQPAYWNGPADALAALTGQYRRERTAGQGTAVFLGVEKNALAGLLQDWFDERGLPVLPLGGYSSEGLDRVVKERVERDGRPAVLIYAGDFDASGMDIGRSFVDTTYCWDRTIRIALSPEQIDTMGLPVLAGKPKDSRAAKFIDRYPEIHARRDFGYEGRNRVPVQCELDAVDPGLLRDLFLDAVAEFWDEDAYQDALDLEGADLSVLRALAAQVGGT